MPTLQARGVEIAWSERGDGPPLLLIHETAATRVIWRPLAESIAGDARAIFHDRRGWGSSSAPEDYRRTTVEEQSEDAACLLEAVAEDPAVVCGSGVGALIALDLMLRRGDLVAAGALIEPPLLQLLPIATEALSDDRGRLEAAAGSREDLVDLYLSGGLPALGPGANRLPEEMAAQAREHPAVLLAELGLPARWRMPLPRLASADRESIVVTCESTPQLLWDAAEALAGRLAGTTRREVRSGGALPHVGAAEELAALVDALRP